jgi:hypothetical protein
MTGGGVLGSVGGNRLQGNSPYNLRNATSPVLTIKAERNIWDYATVAQVLSANIFGSVDVEPLG